MLKIRLICIGKSKGEWTAAATSQFTKLLTRHCAPEIIELPESKRSPDGSVSALRKSELDKLLARLHPRHYVIALDKSGKQYTSEQFAAELAGISQNAPGIDLLIGGAHGLSPDALRHCQKALSLSKMTYSHLIARVVLLEQLYRAFSILAGSPYHK